MNLRLKLLLAGALAGVLGAGLGVASLWQATGALTRSGQAELQARELQVERDTRLALVRDGLAGRLKALRVLAAQRGTAEALRDFKDAMATMVAPPPPPPAPAPAAGTAARRRGAAEPAPPVAAPAADPPPDPGALRDEMLAWVREHFVPDWARQHGGPAPDLTAALEARTPVAARLQQAFIVRNPHPGPQRDRLVVSDEASPYGQAHARHHPAWARARAQIGVDDWLLIDTATHQVVYSTAKDLDFASQLVDGPAAASALAETYARVRHARSPDELALSDIGPYLPAAGRAVLFAAVPVFDGGTQTGVLAWRLGADALAALFRPVPGDAAGGAPVDAYLVGPDRLLRTDPAGWAVLQAAWLEAAGQRLTPEKRALVTQRGSGVGLVPLDNAAVRAALQGELGVRSEPGPDGRPLLVAYAPLRLDQPGVAEPGWVLLAQLPADDAWPVLSRELATRAAFGAAGGLLLGGALLALAAGVVLRPLRRVQATLDQVAQGELTVRTEPRGHDEVAELGRSIDRLLDQRLAPLGEAAQENESLQRAVMALLETVYQLGARDLTARAEVGDDLIGTLAAAINQLGEDTAATLAEVRHVAEQVRDACEYVHEQAARVEDTAQLEHQALEGMATGLNQVTYQLAQMAALSGNSAEAAAEATQANDEARQAMDAQMRGADLLRESIAEAELRFQRLADRSQEVSAVVQVMQSLAERTHVLALNASMQAAHAGEAGRGFNRVVEEVQRLADSAREATAQIAQLVSGIQVETADTLLTLNRLVAQVTRQSTQVRQAGEQTLRARDATARLIGLVGQIGEFSQAQARLADELRAGLDQLQRGASHTAMAIEQQTVSAATLVDYARRLTEAVAQFKLPPAP